MQRNYIFIINFNNISREEKKKKKKKKQDKNEKKEKKRDFSQFFQKKKKKNRLCAGQCRLSQPKIGTSTTKLPFCPFISI